MSRLNYRQRVLKRSGDDILGEKYLGVAPKSDLEEPKE